MKRLVAFIFVITFHISLVFCDNAEHENKCSYLENAPFAPLLSQRFPRSYSSDDYPNLSVFYYGRREPEEEDITKQFNFGYLNEPFSSLDDLYRLNSEEITPHHLPESKEHSKLWNVEDVRNLGPPQVLPDVGLNLARPHDPYEYPVKQQPSVLDEHDIQLGRKIVEDSPSPSEILRIRNLVTPKAKVKKRVQKNQRYPEYHHKTPSVVLNNVIQRREPTFMDELEDIKMSTFPDNSDSSEVTDHILYPLLTDELLSQLKINKTDGDNFIQKEDPDSEEELDYVKMSTIQKYLNSPELTDGIVSSIIHPEADEIGPHLIIDNTDSGNSTDILDSPVTSTIVDCIVDSKKSQAACSIISPIKNNTIEEASVNLGQDLENGVNVATPAPQNQTEPRRRSKRRRSRKRSRKPTTDKPVDECNEKINEEQTKPDILKET